MSDNLRIYAILTLLVTFFLLGILVVYKTGFLSGKSVASANNCTSVTTIGPYAICLGEDVGIKSTYQEAVSYCKKNGMRLPTKSDAWYIWVSSENCRSAFASGADVPEGISQFTEGRSVPSITIENYCRSNSVIKFPMSAQYKQNSFWLAEKKNSKEHYAINYFSATIKSFQDSEDGLGIRCVADLKKSQ